MQLLLALKLLFYGVGRGKIAKAITSFRSLVQIQLGPLSLNNEFKRSN